MIENYRIQEVKSSTQSAPSESPPGSTGQRVAPSVPPDPGLLNGASGTMQPMRRWVVNGLILVTLGLTGLSVVTKREAWPICNYPMFDGLNRRADTQKVEVFVVSGVEERPLHLEHGAWRGTYGLMRNVAVDDSIRVMLYQKGWRSEDSKAFLALILRELERQWKAEGKSAEPPRALRVYAVNYHYPESGDPRPQVLNKTLMLEVKNTTR